MWSCCCFYICPTLPPCGFLALSNSPRVRGKRSLPHSLTSRSRRRSPIRERFDLQMWLDHELIGRASGNLLSSLKCSLSPPPPTTLRNAFSQRRSDNDTNAAKLSCPLSVYMERLGVQTRLASSFQRGGRHNLQGGKSKANPSPLIRLLFSSLLQSGGGVMLSQMLSVAAAAAEHHINL